MTDTVGFSVGAVARRLGVAPSTLRTWNRRYGIGAGQLSPGKHRRYTSEDITRLEHMQKLILRGAAPADAARAAMAAPVVRVPAQTGPDSAEAGLAARADGREPGGPSAVLVPGGAEARAEATPPARDSRPHGQDRGTAPEDSAWRCPVRRLRPAAWPGPRWPWTGDGSAKTSGPHWPATAASAPGRICCSR